MVGIHWTKHEREGLPLSTIWLALFQLWSKKAKMRMVGFFSPHQSICCCCSVTQLCLTLCELVDCRMLGFPVIHHLPELAQIHVLWVSDAIQPSHPLLSLSPIAFNLAQHQGLFKWVSYSHQMAKVLELQLQHQSFQWIFRIDFL